MNSKCLSPNKEVLLEEDESMRMEFAYRNVHSWRTKLGRVAWGVAYWFFFRPTFGRLSLCSRWRNWVLRLFGTTCWHQAQFFPSVRIWAPWNLHTGRMVSIDEHVDIYNVAPITMGHMVSISRRAFLCTASHDISDIKRSLITKPIRIGNGVWIGAQAYIGPGVTIGNGAVIAAGAVVVADVPAWVVVGGNPARPIKDRIVDRKRWELAFDELEKSFPLKALK